MVLQSRGTRTFLLLLWRQIVRSCWSDQGVSLRQVSGKLIADSMELHSISFYLFHKSKHTQACKILGLSRHFAMQTWE
jgi:hypothetical protein